MPPSGDTSDAAQAYYNYLYAHYLQEIPSDRTQILWSGPFWIFFWAAIMIVFFFLFSTTFGHVHRQRGELYGAASFAGSILERIGTLSVFSWVVWAGVVLWGLYYMITPTLSGYIY